MYHEDNVTKTHNGGLADMRHERKLVWVYPNLANPSRCPVRIIDKYLSLCPKVTKKPNLYLQSLIKPTPKQWYSGQVVGQNTIAKVVKTLMRDAGIPGYFTNHSTRRTGGTRLFRADVQRKLVKEATGNCSDAIDKYQITSDKQREMMSAVIASKPNDQVCETNKLIVDRNNSGKEDTAVLKVITGEESEVGSNQIDASNVGDVVKSLIDGS